MLKIKLPLVLSFLLALSACGGGGGGGSSGTTPTPEPVVPPTLDLRTAWNNFGTTTSTNNFTISGVLNNLTLGGSGTLLITNSSPASVNVFNPSNPFLGKTVTLSNLVKVNSATSGTLIESGTSTAISAAEELYVDTNGQYKAINDVGANEQTLITSFTNLPNAVTAGSGGSFYTGTIYSRLGYTCGTSTSSFTVASETNTSLLVTFTNSQNTQQQAVGQCSTSVFTSQIIYRLTANGITLVKRTASDSNFTGSLIQTFQQASGS